jgi:hypothetical protein
MSKEWRLFVLMYAVFILLSLLLPAVRLSCQAFYYSIKLMFDPQMPGGFISIGNIPVSMYLQFFFYQLCYHLFTAYIYKIALHCIHGERINYRFGLKKCFFILTAWLMILALISLLSIILELVLPGGEIWIVLAVNIFFKMKFMYYSLLIVDTNANPFQALSQSWRLTGNFFSVLLLWLFLAGVFLAGIAASGIGALYALPLISVIIACSYDDKKRSLPIRFPLPFWYILWMNRR